MKVLEYALHALTSEHQYCTGMERAGLVVSLEDMHVGLLFRRQIRMRIRLRVKRLITGESDTDEIERTSSFCRDDESGS